MLLEVALAYQQLPYQRLAIRHIKIRLNPHAAHQFPSFVLYLLRYAFEQRRIFLLHPFAVLRRGLRINRIRIFIQQLQRAGESAAYHVDRLRLGPQPGCVDMRIACQVRGQLPKRILQRTQCSLRFLQ